MVHSSLWWLRGRCIMPITMVVNPGHSHSCPGRDGQWWSMPGGQRFWRWHGRSSLPPAAKVMCQWFQWLCMLATRHGWNPDGCCFLQPLDMAVLNPWLTWAPVWELSMLYYCYYVFFTQIWLWSAFFVHKKWWWISIGVINCSSSFPSRNCKPQWTRYRLSQIGLTLAQVIDDEYC